MEMGTERIQKIVQSLRNFSRLDEAEMKVANIHEGIDNTLLILNHRLKQGIEVVKKYGDLSVIPCYPAQLNQVFMNILANAIDALMAEEAQLVKQIVIETQKVDSKQIRVGIWNNGSRIPYEIRDKLFDPFFTTKPAGQGTGLGLSICYQIVEKHGGKIEVISEPGQGTEFAIVLPLQAENCVVT
jgi:signal transduction histidine kinase